MSRISLDADQIQLLRDVAAGKVARHRLGRGRSPALGQDFQEDPGRGPGGLRKAKARLAPLERLKLVRLPAGLDTVASWAWKTTELGAVVLEELDTHTATTPHES